MSASVADTRKFFGEYVDALSGHPKTAELLDRFVSDPALKEHIIATEAVFPSYEFLPEQIVIEGDTIAVRATFRGVHQGTMAGIEPTGKQVSAPLMIFYRVGEGRIAEHWMEMNTADVIRQLTEGGVLATA